MTNAQGIALAGVAVLAVAAVVAYGPIAQPPEYHVMADQRTLFGLSNGLNVVSNAPFVIVGLLGLAVVFRRRAAFRDPWERWPYAALFGGTGVAALGSTYYHLAPDNARLVWDRLPMAFGFMGLLTAVLAECVSVRMARAIFIPLLVIGPATVLYWYATELAGRGDLRPYLLVQFGSLLLVTAALLLYRSRYGDSRYWVTALVAYVVAKLFEMADGEIFALGHLVSGHTLKHVMAAASVGCVVVMIGVRRPALKEDTR